MQYYRNQCKNNHGKKTARFFSNWSDRQKTILLTLIEKNNVDGVLCSFSPYILLLNYEKKIFF